MPVLIALYLLVIVTAIAIAVDHWLATPADARLRQALWEHVWFGELALTLAYTLHNTEHQPCGRPGRAPAQAETDTQGGTPDPLLGETSCCSGPSLQ